METYCYNVSGVVVVHFMQCFIVGALLSMTGAFMFQCSNSSGLAAIVCNWQFTIESSFFGVMVCVYLQFSSSITLFLNHNLD
jgi:hypothetical protein